MIQSSKTRRLTFSGRGFLLLVILDESQRVNSYSNIAALLIITQIFWHGSTCKAKQKRPSGGSPLAIYTFTQQSLILR